RVLFPITAAFVKVTRRYRASVLTATHYEVSAGEGFHQTKTLIKNQEVAVLVHGAYCMKMDPNAAGRFILRGSL
ncbi:MAG TPA: hypothetical protein VMM84_17525, partial [Pyrinomonadaceae bacterium]|nr:hypothetical protein [Pyrinomonadaceae bacterium]